jgi:hypothetical protein
VSRSRAPRAGGRRRDATWRPWARGGRACVSFCERVDRRGESSQPRRRRIAPRRSALACRAIAAWARQRPPTQRVDVRQVVLVVDLVAQSCRRYGARRCTCGRGRRAP